MNLTHDGKEIRDNEYYVNSVGHGTSTVMITCPFCKAKTEAYIWSLSGSGKRCCGCGAVHGVGQTISKNKVES